MGSRFMKPVAIMTIFLMLASGFAVFVPAPVGAAPEEPVLTETGPSSRDTESANDAINGADVLTSGVPHPGSLLVSPANDQQDWYRIDCSRGQAIYADVYLEDWNAADPGQHNLNVVLYGPEEEGSLNYVPSWFSFLQSRHETASTLCAFTAPYFLWVLINVTGDNPPQVATDPTSYTVTLTVENPTALNGGAQEQATLSQDSANWFKWYKANTPKDQSFNARLTNPNGGNIDMDMFGLWARGYDAGAGYQGYQPFFMNQTRNDATNGNVEQMAGMTGDLDVYIRLWLRSGSGLGQYTFQLQNAMIPSDGDNVPGDAQLIEKTQSKVYHGHQACDHFDWYKFNIDAGFTVDITFSLETVKSSYWNLTIWDSDLEYVEGWFNTQDGSHYRDPQDDDPNAISSAGVTKMDWDPPSPGTYYIMVMPIAGDPVNNMRGPPLADQYYRLYLGLPNYGPNIKSTIGDASIDEDESFGPIDLSDYFEDPEGDPLTFSVSDDTNKVTTTLVGDSNVTAIPVADWSGICNITVEATDGGANIGDNTVEQTFKLTVNPINDDPFVKPGMAFTNFSMFEGQSNIQTYPKTLTDVFGDIDSTLTFSYSGNTKVQVRIDQATKDVFFTAPDLWFGTENITFSAKDQGTNVAKVTVKVTVKHKNHAPTLGFGGKSTYSIEMDEDDEGDFSLNVASMFEDIDTEYQTGDYLVYRLKDPLPLHLNVTILEDNTLSIVPEPDWSGDGEFKIMCEDTFGVQNTTTVYVTVEPVNDEPEITAYTPTDLSLAINEDKAQVFMISSVIDIDNEYYDIRYNWFVDNELQDDDNVQGKQYTFRTVFQDADGFAEGVYHIKCVVTDGELEDEVEWTIEVVDVNQPPTGARIVTPTSDVPYKQGKPLVFEADMNASDPDGDPLYFRWVEHDKNVTLSEERSFTFDWSDKELKKAMGPGKHTIDLYVSDGRNEEIKTSVTITIKKKEDKQQPGFEGLVLLGALMVVLVLVDRRRRR